MHIVKQVPLLLAEEHFGVDRRRIVAILHKHNLGVAQLGAQRNGQILRVHGKVVELEFLVEDAAHEARLGHPDRVLCAELVVDIRRLVVAEVVRVALGRILALHNVQLVGGLAFGLADRVKNVYARRPVHVRVVFERLEDLDESFDEVARVLVIAVELVVGVEARVVQSD